MTHYIYYGLIAVAIFASCGRKDADRQEEAAEQASESQDLTAVTLSDDQVKKLGITVGQPTDHEFTGSIGANGVLATTPQSEALVTPKAGGNVQRILVREGQTVRRGEVVVWLSHPDYVDLQSRYLTAVHRQQYLRKEFQRQSMMMNERVGTGKDYDRIEADLRTAEGEVSMLAMQLHQLGINPSAVRNGKPVATIAVRSPIEGTVERIDAETGQYVGPDMPMMHIVNTDNIYADLLVFQRDIAKVRIGQKVILKLQSGKGSTYDGQVYSIGKVFAQDAQAVHVRVNIGGSHDGLISGMYVQGQIASTAVRQKALPSEAIVDEDGRSYVFTAKKEGAGWKFDPIEIVRGKEENGMTAISLKKSQQTLNCVSLSAAYYLLSEMKKGETGEE